MLEFLPLKNRETSLIFEVSQKGKAAVIWFLLLLEYWEKFGNDTLNASSVGLFVYVRPN